MPEKKFSRAHVAIAALIVSHRSGTGGSGTVGVLATLEAGRPIRAVLAGTIVPWVAPVRADTAGFARTAAPFAIRFPLTDLRSAGFSAGGVGSYDSVMAGALSEVGTSSDSTGVTARSVATRSAGGATRARVPDESVAGGGIPTASALSPIS